MTHYLDVHEMTIRRIEEWSQTLVVMEGAVTSSSALYADYQRWSADHRRHGVTQNLWGKWMGEHYAKRRSRGLTAYVGIRVRKKNDPTFEAKIEASEI
ncbi:MAG TPA: hypothetical protein VER98_18590 [Terriglobia bacterium]|nr:hypothetical protein [Terriglobia bacterium]